MSTNQYLSLTGLAGLNSLLDANEMMVIVGPGGGQGSATTVGSIPLASFRDDYLLTEVNEQIAELQSRPGNGAFASPVTMTLTGVVTGSTSFDGSQNFSLATTMPDNSIPITAVQDLASTLAGIEASAGAPDQLASSYYSNFNATAQTSILGYWNASSTNANGNDQFGTILQLASDGALGPSSSNYVNQLCFGTNGTMTWRRNVGNSAWSMVSLWHSGNFTPSNYLSLASGGTVVGTFTTSGITNLAHQAVSTPGYSTNGVVQLAGGTITDTVNSGTVGTFAAVAVPTPTFATNSATTYTNGVSLYIAGSPVNGSNVTITTAYSLMVATGRSWFGGPVTANGTTGAGLTVVTSGSAGSLVIQDTGTNGANLTLTGNGSTTPSKVIRVLSGTLQFINSAYNTVLLSLGDSGGLTGVGTFISGTTSGLLAVGGQAASNQSTYFRYDGTMASAISGTPGTFYTIWNSNNFNPNAPTFGSTIFLATSTEVDIFLRSGNSASYQTYYYNNTGGSAGVALCDVNGGFAGSVFNWNRQTGAFTIGYPTQINSTITSTGAANFNTSDRRLKKNLKRVAPRALHRDLPWYSYERRDTGEKGLGPTAQDAQNLDDLFVNEYDHPIGKVSKTSKVQRTVKRLAMDKLGIALEESMWAGREVDRLTALVDALSKRLTAAEKTVKALRKRA